jgi:hypothetical protein
MGIREAAANAVASSEVRDLVKSAAAGETVAPEAFAVLKDADAPCSERSLVLPDEHAAGSAARAAKTTVAKLRSRV